MRCSIRAIALDVGVERIEALSASAADRSRNILLRSLVKGATTSSFKSGPGSKDERHTAHSLGMFRYITE